MKIQRVQCSRRQKRDNKSSRWLGRGFSTGLLSFVIGMSALLLPACGQTKGTVPEFVLTYAENQTEDYPTTQGAEYFASLVEKRTNGRIQVLVYPDARLGEEVSAVSQVKLGGIDFIRASLSTVSAYSDESIVLMLPYLYRDSDHMWKVLNSDIGTEIMNSFRGSGLVPLSWYDAGVRNFYFTTKVTDLAGFQGKSIRVQQSDLMEAMVRCLGAVSVPLSYSDVYGALERGEADGAENNWTSYEAMDHYKVAPYFLMDGHMRVPELQIMSQSTMDKLSESDQWIIRACASESSTYQQKLWQEQETAAREKVLAEGATQIDLSEAEKAKFREAMAPLYEEYAGNYTALVDRIEEMQKE